MKFIGLLITLLVFSATTSIGQVKHHNRIDDINSVQDVLDIVRPLLKDSNFVVNGNSWFINNIARDNIELINLVDSLKPPSYYKTDIDNNGWTDLIVRGRSGDELYLDSYVFCLMDSGENKFSIKFLTDRIKGESSFPIVKFTNSLPLILYYQISDNYRRKIPSKIKLDTLIFKYGAFIEYDKNPKPNQVRKIEFKTTSCFGDCPIFNLTIASNKKATFKAIRYNIIKKNGQENILKGEYHCTIDSQSFQQIMDLLSYMDIEKLNDKYSIIASDFQTSTLIINDSYGTKIVNDYGLMGTFGLRRLYDLLFELRNSQDWRR